MEGKMPIFDLFKYKYIDYIAILKIYICSWRSEDSNGSKVQKITIINLSYYPKTKSFFRIFFSFDGHLRQIISMLKIFNSLRVFVKFNVLWWVSIIFSNRSKHRKQLIEKTDL
jgi:hypothetical protein